MDIFSIITLFGGLALFLYGMSVMSSGLEKLASGKLETILYDMTSSKVKSLLLGAGVTAVIQSSSAVTVMLVGLVNSGIMSTEQTVGAIMGSNIGTTITAWLLSLVGVSSDNIVLNLLKPQSFSPIMALVGVILFMAAKSNKKKDSGLVMIGFAILMYGMSFMSESMEPLQHSEKFTGILTALNNPILGVLAGLLITAIIQSSSASVGILQAISMTGGLSYGMAIPIIMGQNIGTCVTSLISSIGVNRNAKRVAAIHISFNIIGTIIFMGIFYLAHYIVDFSFINNSVSPVNIAILHSLFNILTTIILYPFSNKLVNISNKIVHFDKDEEENTEFLDDLLLKTPAIAVDEARKKMKEMLIMAFDNFERALKLSDQWDEKIFKKLVKTESKLDYYEDQLSGFNIKIAGEELSDENSRAVSMMLHTITDAERIGDRSLNIAESVKELIDKGIVFSDDARKELNIIAEALREIVYNTKKCFIEGDIESAYMVEPIEEVIDDLVEKSKDNHVARLKNGSCTLELGLILNDILINLERISDHCSNIAADKIEMEGGNLHLHEYKKKIKEQKDDKFAHLYSEYSNKYNIE
ncbi:Na/Pi cotransporter family protein [Alterileibacterium massiliense]|uniref:Na/Pi cotransporter family protein n=1 Tax=Alterileibacterium massiliense TaxID=1870997 RepID=UPI0008D984EE|nr:Na/Pi cotransporter family protein [Alterileibacterium massiliense]